MRYGAATIRRYALSLGISGQLEQALEKLDPLLRKTDRAAWRARAFILAMGGELPEATRIASTMMPPQLAQGLQPFFQRLPSLPAVDRAFAVHFGETRPTPERLADAKLAPNLPPLTPEAPVALASAPVTTPAPVTTREERRRGGRNARGVAMAANTTPVTPAPVQMASTTTPRVVAAAAPMRMVQPLPQPQSQPTPQTVQQTQAQPQPQPGFSSALPTAPETRSPVALASNTARPMIQPLPAAPATAPATPAPTTPAPVTSSPTTAMVQPLSAATPSHSPLQLM